MFSYLYYSFVCFILTKKIIKFRFFIFFNFSASEETSSVSATSSATSAVKKVPELPKDNDETKNDEKEESGSIKDGTGPAPGAFYVLIRPHTLFRNSG